MFKKKKIYKKKKSNRIINIFWLIVIFSVFIFWIFSLSLAKQFDFFNNLKVVDNIEWVNIEVIKDKEDHKINILLLWRGGIRNDAPDLTDSIILASINKKTKTISMFSIPRDLYVEYKNGKSWKINKAYAIEKAKTWNKEAWIDALKYNIELLTSEIIDYYINIDFNGFVKFIDAIGWIQIEVKNTLIDEKFPDNNWGYRTFIVKKWNWLFDWETALNYARSRHSTSDFDRSLRQQQILQSVRNKLTEGWFFSKLSKAKAFYDVFIKYVITDIWLTDSIDIFKEVKNNEYKIISSNLNDSCFEWDPFCVKWWFLYTPERELYWGASVLLVNWSQIWKLNDYSQMEKYIDLVFNNTNIYKENINISVYNSTVTPLLAWNLSFELRKYWFNIPISSKSVWTLRWKVFTESFVNYKKEILDS